MINAMIYKLRRLSDGKFFEEGDYVTSGTMEGILGFDIKDNKIIARLLLKENLDNLKTLEGIEVDLDSVEIHNVVKQFYK